MANKSKYECNWSLKSSLFGDNLNALRISVSVTPLAPSRIIAKVDLILAGETIIFPCRSSAEYRRRSMSKKFSLDISGFKPAFWQSRHLKQLIIRTENVNVTIIEVMKNIHERQVLLEDKATYGESKRSELIRTRTKFTQHSGCALTTVESLY